MLAGLRRPAAPPAVIGGGAARAFTTLAAQPPARVPARPAFTRRRVRMVVLASAEKVRNEHGR